ncbi:MAG: glycoside hydrolase family 13 protein [Clostridia bacterium]|nr:glycoside hydrolase family 13 protein [Clostridia bacterium]
MIPFDSGRKEYKSVFGSIAAGNSLRLRVLLPRELHVSAVRLVVDAETEIRKFNMYWESTDGTTEWWGTDFSHPSPALLFYHFEFDTPWGVSKIRRIASREGSFTQPGEPWQLTVYDPAFQTPDWIKGGILYQIFPDRFCRSGTTLQMPMNGRTLRTDWDGVPEWRPNTENKITNSDFFGGDLKGIQSKLPYLAELGVTCIYLNPICLSASNHRYDTSDYSRVDPYLGTNNDFSELCAASHKLGIRVLFDGVYSHTGDDSVYFNKYGHFDSVGAYQSADSPYAQWYTFRNGRDKYDSWWGIDTLPEVREENEDYLQFITGQNGILPLWLNLGADGVRLDVADELPDVFLDAVRNSAKNAKTDAFVLGEVWEDASNKISYSHRRHYLLGKQLDSVMNYPFRDAVLDFCRDGLAEKFTDRILVICENYPNPSLHTLMNMLGTHDTQRVLTYLAGVDCNGRSREWQAAVQLTQTQYNKAKQLFKIALVLQYTLPGVPCIYYGDEAGLTGCNDPFNRGCYPWGHEDHDLLSFVKELGSLRRKETALKTGDFISVSAMLQCVCYLRMEDAKNGIMVIANKNDHAIDYRLHSGIQCVRVLFNGCENGRNTVHVEANSACIMKIYKE